MSLIKTAAELTIPETVKIMIYGQAGTGKTTLSLSAPSPLLLDFDGGVKRVNMEHLSGVDIVQIARWEDMLEVLGENLTKYKTIVVDTIGKMMDYIITYKCGQRQPQLRDWGAINAEFQTTVRNLSALGKNIIFIAHRDTRKDGDETVFIPSLREKSYNSIVTELDLLGYLEMRTDNGRQVRTVTFDPTSRNDGKNTCNLPAVMPVPVIVDRSGKVTAPNDFIAAQILAPYAAMLRQKAEAQKAYESLTRQIDADIRDIDTAEGADKFAAEVKTAYDHVGSSLDYARAALARRCGTLGLKYDKTAKKFVSNANA